MGAPEIWRLKAAGKQEQQAETAGRRSNARPLAADITLAPSTDRFFAENDH
ncbi:hypothetical protein MMB17_03955 [Methylobacterium organophilum]|uniref:hypothetical protein n=1 Tax=Methylobacterium organophilum TaxID=410 RepID=UPI001F144B00|nr:hypothetical protein [Methylobacterium organophilum]UMY18502.1 hypothetical protein MMB17_03955 [Methylobacterium organophilum]